jgi:cytochrome c biogenesis protein CcdA
MAFWFGILTSISPCPLATNIVAVSYIGGQLSTQRWVFLAGVLYMLGRMLTYSILGMLLISGTQSVPAVANFLQKYMNLLMGPTLVLVGLVLLKVVNFNMGNTMGGIVDKLQGRIQHLGLLGAVLLGGIFALSFCPVSAALFFGSLFSLALKHESGVVLPSIYGIGTAIPVLGFAILMGVSASMVSKACNKVAVFEIWARRITAVVFILAGLYYFYIYVV